MPRTGRPTKLTPEVQKKIVDALSAGNYFEVACEYAGIVVMGLSGSLPRARAYLPSQPFPWIGRNVHGTNYQCGAGAPTTS